MIYLAILKMGSFVQNGFVLHIVRLRPMKLDFDAMPSGQVRLYIRLRSPEANYDATGPSSLASFRFSCHPGSSPGQAPSTEDTEE
jgi:hypothetical protein